jgi:hypothetical protein
MNHRKRIKEEAYSWALVGLAVWALLAIVIGH